MSVTKNKTPGGRKKSPEKKRPSQTKGSKKFSQTKKNGSSVTKSKSESRRSNLLVLWGFLFLLFALAALGVSLFLAFWPKNKTNPATNIQTHPETGTTHVTHHGTNPVTRAKTQTPGKSGGGGAGEGIPTNPFTTVPTIVPLAVGVTFGVLAFVLLTVAGVRKIVQAVRNRRQVAAQEEMLSLGSMMPIGIRDEDLIEEERRVRGRNEPGFFEPIQTGQEEVFYGPMERPTNQETRGRQQQIQPRSRLNRMLHGRRATRTHGQVTRPTTAGRGFFSRFLFLIGALIYSIFFAGTPVVLWNTFQTQEYLRLQQQQPLQQEQQTSLPPIILQPDILIPPPLDILPTPQPTPMNTPQPTPKNTPQPTPMRTITDAPFLESVLLFHGIISPPPTPTGAIQKITYAPFVDSFWGGWNRARAERYGPNGSSRPNNENMIPLGMETASQGASSRGQSYRIQEKVSEQQKVSGNRR